MENLQKYNSKAIKEAFPEVYKDFFSICATVISAPGNFLWAGNYGLLSGSLGVTQNLPLRVYVGLEETCGGQVIFGKCFVFDSQEHKFIDYKMNQTIKEEVSLFLEEEFKKILTQRKFKGLKIHLLSEMPIGYGVNASGALAAALVSAAFLHYQLLAPSELINFSISQTEKLIKNNLFNRLFRFAWKLESIFHGGLTSGVGAFTPFIGGRSPIAYFIEEPLADGDEKKSGGIKFFCDIGQGVQKNFNLIDRMRFNAFRVSELSVDKREFFFPFDFGLINSSASGASIIANRALECMGEMLQETEPFFQKIFIPYLEQRGFTRSAIFKETFSPNPAQKVWGSLLHIISTFSVNILFALHQLNRKYFSASDFGRLAENLNKYQNIYRIVGTSSLFTERLYSLLEQKVRSLNYECGVGFKLTNNTHGGFIIFVINSHRLRKKIFEVVEEVKKEIKESITVDWISWRDGLENEGIKIEQSLTNQIYSNFISRGALIVLHLDESGLHEDLYTLEEFSRAKKDMDVLLDSINEEIWIKGEKITSKELRTVTNTIVTLKILLENVRTEIIKSKLPDSGYLKDRNEFQSKIASPLVKVIEKRLKRRISFNIKGPIVNFTMNFDPKDVEFFYIKKGF